LKKNKKKRSGLFRFFVEVLGSDFRHCLVSVAMTEYPLANGLAVLDGVMVVPLDRAAERAGSIIADNITRSEIVCPMNDVKLNAVIVKTFHGSYLSFFCAFIIPYFERFVNRFLKILLKKFFKAYAKNAQALLL
jgi:hypothetical protein